jgi:hypothetical protein
MKRTKQQWLELIQAQQISDLSIVDFCREKTFLQIIFMLVAVLG